LSFDTATFWLFFVLAWAAWRLLPFGMSKWAVLLASFVFYGWWNPWYLPLIVASAGIDFFVGHRIHASANARVRRAWLTCSVAANLSLLVSFKYTPFLAQAFGPILAQVGLEPRADWGSWVIPVGISFYTFQSLSYSIDIYRGQLVPARSFRDFLLFVSFFPQLVAGPIVRARELLPQFAERRPINVATLQTGAYHVIQGLFLKVVIADTLAPDVFAAFMPLGVANLDPVGAWLGVIYFGVQIFADFAGYSGIAIGLAYLMGLRFPANFLAPYISASLSEFWRRWHISLSQWLRDYLYIPLGGNRGGPAKVYRSLMLTMLLGGLWHGAAWTFVAGGGLQGLGLCIEGGLRKCGVAPGHAGAPRGARDWIGRLGRILIVFIFVNTAWVFFRAENFQTAWTLLGRMYVAPFTEPWGLGQLSNEPHLFLLLPIVMIHIARLASEWYGVRTSPRVKAIACALMLLALTVLRRQGTSEFIYFQF
jgi:alginate O-acetyltransferase complex protein AlgI